MKTVAAISTPSGRGGIGTVRISGDDAFTVADKVFKSVSGKKIADIEGYSALFGRVYDSDGVFDEAVCLKFCAPKSYTGENVAELSVHGGGFVLKRLLRAVLSAGAVTAGPGEFTKRAFQNGKMDLSKAESVMALIGADTASQLKLAVGAEMGKISDSVNGIIKQLLTAASDIGAFADYPDEDIPDLSVENIEKVLWGAKEKLAALLSSYDSGRIITEGVRTAIVGKPNVGKSTLMNLLSNAERSIVTPIAGTTRDIIEDRVSVGDITLILSDTAGIHETGDGVEKVGVEKAKERMAQSELVIAVFDGSKSFDNDDLSLLESIKNTVSVAVINKTDLGTACDLSLLGGLPYIKMSALKNDGTEELKAAICKRLEIHGIDGDAAVLISERQRDCAARAFSAAEEALSALGRGVTLDAVGVLTDEALTALYELTGERVTEAVTDEIFSRFCVGK